MKTYFWYAKRIEQSVLCANESFGLVEAETPNQGLDLAQNQAKKDLGNTWHFVIKQFNEV